MEEKKNEKMKVVKNKEVNNPDADLQKKLVLLSEEYNKVVSQAQALAQKLNEVQIFNAFKRLEFLFKVLEYQDNFHTTFVDAVVDEIENTITLKEQVEKTEETKDEEA